MEYLISLTGWPGTSSKRGVPGCHICLHCWTKQRAICLLLPSEIATANWFSLSLSFITLNSLSDTILVSQRAWRLEQGGHLSVLPWGFLTWDQDYRVWLSHWNVTRTTTTKIILKIPSLMMQYFSVFFCTCFCCLHQSECLMQCYLPPWKARALILDYAMA